MVDLVFTTDCADCNRIALLVTDYSVCQLQLLTIPAGSSSASITINEGALLTVTQMLMSQQKRLLHLLPL
jgi:hypothetical protein